MLEAGNNSELPAIPGKRYFTIGEVSELCGVKPHVLRYWEQEFPQLKPGKRRGNRDYETLSDQQASRHCQIVGCCQCADRRIEAVGDSSQRVAGLDGVRGGLRAHAAGEQRKHGDEREDEDQTTHGMSFPFSTN